MSSKAKVNLAQLGLHGPALRPAMIEVPARGGLDSASIALMRIVLSSSVLFIIGSSELDDLGAFDILAVLYTCYSILLYISVVRQFQPAISRFSFWGDVAWAALLTGYSDDPSTALIFLFPTLIASFQWSFNATLRFTLVATQLLVVTNIFKAQVDPDLQLPEILLPPIYLLIFGYLVARWGEREIASKRRLVLLKEITRLSNPRFGIDRMIGRLMERLRDFYAAEACLLIVTDPSGDEYLLRQTDHRDAERGGEADIIPAETGRLLLAQPLERAMIYLGASRLGWWRRSKPNYYVVDVRESQLTAVAQPANEALIAVVDAESFISVPLHDSDSTTGRLYLIASRRNAFSAGDLSFLLQVIEQIVPVIENIRLVDQLASNAAKEERRRLARDIHDNVIQPYIGFQIGLAALSEKLAAGTVDIGREIAQLRAITDQGIDVLRGYIHHLPGADERESVLLAAVRRFAGTFTETTHIAVHVDAAADLYINDRLAAEVFQMVVEGLSNIRRHTHAACVNIRFACQNDSLLLRIVNDGAGALTPTRFIPWSISERATALGGYARGEHIIGGDTQVIVEIPL